MLVPVWKRDLSTSAGIATAQLNIPAIPPANSTLGILSSPWLDGWASDWERERSRQSEHVSGYVLFVSKTLNEAVESLHLFPAGVRRFFNHSYDIKYMPLAGTSESHTHTHTKGRSFYTPDHWKCNADQSLKARQVNADIRAQLSWKAK